MLPAVGLGAAALKYATPILATTGALLGGKQAYEESGGDIGATALGAGLSALGLGAVPGVGRRMANVPGVQRLGKAAVESGTAQKIGQTAQRLAGQGALGNPLQQQMLGQQILGGAGALGLAGLGAYAVPKIASGVAGGAKNVGSNLLGGASQVAGAGMALNTMIDPNTGVVYQTPAVPGNLPKPYNVGDVVNPTEYFAAQRLNEKLLQDLALRGTKEAAAFQLPEIDRIKQRDLQRELTARKIATDLQTAQTMMLQGQLGAQALGQNTLGNIGAAARTQYRYL